MSVLEPKSRIVQVIKTANQDTFVCLTEDGGVWEMQTIGQGLANWLCLYAPPIKAPNPPTPFKPRGG